ncbi:hypothetical protein COU00_00085 [Candidatus Falkowbacteria bacterium CG10_big_fil_rev_8_21_14_0_10_43_11]|uniref:Uncharacterized protein n=1 Tax=Candidatus Falkowbacteria bacterium CG10_big_fil_rev_8_21_14_0_10_43_11 TaxID=1974568 RepID=A0A2M6WN73_9BACT|nr:MAG: hypothetical protein COU00_00085 [Candidatus Falkowbacteria bacterium CG10_big_fil_rev_8_21_14_0_10_43_11]
MNAVISSIDNIAHCLEIPRNLPDLFSIDPKLISDSIDKTVEKAKKKFPTAFTDNQVREEPPPA